MEPETSCEELARCFWNEHMKNDLILESLFFFEAPSYLSLLTCLHATFLPSTSLTDNLLPVPPSLVLPTELPMGAQNVQFRRGLSPIGGRVVREVRKMVR